MISDVIVSPYHLQFDEVTEKAGKFIDSVYYFQFEDFNSSWLFNYNPNFDRYTMGRGTGAISCEKTSYNLSLSSPHVSLYDTTSQLLWNLVVDHQCSNSISQCFSDDSVAVLTDDGFYFYYVNRELKKTFNFHLKKNIYVMDACFWEGGFVALLTTGDLYQYNFSSKPILLKHFDEISKPVDFSIVPPEKSPTGKLLAYLLVHRGDGENKDSALIVVSENYFYTVRFKEIITHFAISANYKKIAILTEDFNMRVCSIDLQTEEFKKQVESNGHFEVVNVCWVGDVAPVVCFQGVFTLVTLDREGMAMWALDDKESFTLGFTDVDSCIIISSEMSYRIRYVPRRIYYIFSKSPRKPSIPSVYDDEDDIDDADDNSESNANKWNIAKRICEAFINRFDEPPISKLGSIGSTDVLMKAVKSCLEAAEFFFDADVQDFFLNVACFTLAYMDGKTSLMHDYLIRIKILNLVRKLANLKITTAQIFDIGIYNLIGRLISRNMNFVAMDIAKILRMPTIDIQKDSISKAIVNNKNDETCFNIVVEIIQSEIKNDKNQGNSSQVDLLFNDRLNNIVNTVNLSQNSLVDYSYAAMCAIKDGRKELAASFCNLEPNFALKAKIFSKLGDWDLALRHAEASCDSSSLFKVIKHMMKIVMEPDYSLINKAIASYETSAMFVATHENLLGTKRALEILNLVDPRCHFWDARFRFRLMKFKSENENPPNEDNGENDDDDDSKNKNAKKPDSPTTLKRCQKELAIKNNDYSFVGISFNDTLRKIFTMPATASCQKDAFDLAERCGISSINVATIAIRTYALNGKWNDLKKFILDKSFKSLWPLVIETALIQKNDQFASEFANEVAAGFNDNSLLEQYKNNEFNPSELSSMPSFQKHLFRKPSFISFFKLGS